MSDSDMDLEFDSEEEMENLRTLRRVIECDDSSLTESQSTNFSSQQGQSLEPTKYTENDYINLSLALNKQQDEKLLQLEKNLEHRLMECREMLKKVGGRKISEVERSESFRYINCGRPYFKDKENFAAPDNNDALIMARNHMFDFSTVTSVPGWTMRDKTQLWNQIEHMTKSMIKKELQSKIASLQREAKNKKYNEKVVIEKHISKIKREVSKLSSKTLDEIALPIEKEYDWEEITHYLDRRHSAAEYQSLWKLYLHPSINKTNWSKVEHQLLHKVAHKHNLHDWETIAQEMGNNRTGYQCFVYFRTNMNNTFTGKKWSDEEVDYLLRLIEYYKEDDYIPWVKVAALMENRTKIQIYNKYTRLLEQRKGRFLQEEDAVLLTCVDDFGPNFKKMAEFLPGRSICQIRVRYQALNKKRVSTVWTVEEDRKLLQLLSNQDSTANYASITQYFPGKDRIHIRTRYVTLLKWMRRNPNADIVKAPRRGARRLGHGKPSENLNIAVESLRSRIQTEANKKRSTKLNIESSEDAIEDSIVAALVNENLCNEKMALNNIYFSEHVSVLENNCNNIFDSLNDGNLQKLLLLLRAKLNNERFEKHYSNLIRSKLYKPGDQSCTVKVKSYSKQNKIKSIELLAPPNIWGNKTFDTLEYVLPPNYATITGCRKLMSFITAKQQIEEDLVDGLENLNFSVLGRRNVIIREQLDILMERFNTLFLWPLLLSNESPQSENVNGLPLEMCAPVEKEVPLSREHTLDSDHSDGEVCATGGDKNNMDVDRASETGMNLRDDCIQVNLNDNKYSLSVKRC